MDDKSSLSFKQLASLFQDQSVVSFSPFLTPQERKEAKPLKTLQGHTDRVQALAAVGGGILASGSRDRTIRLWYVESGQCFKMLEGHTAEISELAVLDSNILVSNGSYPEKKIRIWKWNSEKCLRKSMSGGFSLTAFGGDILAISKHDLIEIYKWDERKNKCKCVKTLWGRKGSNIISLVALNSDVLASSSAKQFGSSGTNDNTIWVWDWKSDDPFKPLKTLQGHTDRVYALAAVGGGLLASGSSDKTIRLWRIDSGQCVKTLQGHTHWVCALAVVGNGILASGSWDHTIRLWHIESGECIATLQGHTGSVSALAAVGGGLLASGSDDKTIRLWQVLPVLTPKERVSLLQVLKKNKNLKRLDLSGVQFKGIGEALTDLLRENKTIEQLDLSDMQMTDKDAEMLLPVLKTRRSIRLVLDGNPLSADMQSQLTVAADFDEEKEKKKREAFSPQKPLEEKEEKKQFALPSSHLISHKDLKLEKKLGEGGFGIVYEAEWQHSKVAVKTLLLKQMTASAEEEFKKESFIMAKLHHPHIVQFFGVCLKPYYMIMELMPRGSLFAVLHNEKPLAWNIRYQIAMDVTSGLAHLHIHNIMHNDLKSLNILLSDTMRAKLTDFGLSKVKQETTTTTKMGGVNGTPAWMAPELFARRAKYTKEADVYSLGMVFWELATGKKPFADAVSVEILIAWISKGEQEEIPKECQIKRPQYSKLITACWFKPQNRPTIEQVAERLKKAAPEFSS